MKLSSVFICTLLASTLLLPACAAPKHSSEPPTTDDIRENAKRLGKQKDSISVVEDDRNCVDSEINSSGVQVRTCLVHDNASQPGYMNYEMATPAVTTVVKTSKGTFGNPMAWTVQVRRNGELIVNQALSTQGQEIIEREGSLEIESYFNLGDSREILPGEYEVIITPEGENAEPIRSVITVPENPEEPIEQQIIDTE